MNKESEFIVFADNFDGIDRVNGDNWKLPEFPDPPSENDPNTTFLGRTQFRVGTYSDSLPEIEDNLPIVVNGVAQIRLDTLNPIILDPPENSTGQIANPSLFGTELIINQDFELGSGLAFEARMRVNAPIANPTVGGGTTQKGLVASLFSFFGREIGLNQALFDEIDFEFLTNDINNAEQNTQNSSLVLTNVYNDDPPGIGSPGAPIKVENLDLTQFNTFRIEWLPDRIRWFVNDEEILTRTDIVPDEAKTIRLNFWAPKEEGFQKAFDPSLQPVQRQAGDTNQDLLARNQTFFYEVDYVKVDKLGKIVLESDEENSISSLVYDMTQFGDTNNVTINLGADVLDLGTDTVYDNLIGLYPVVGVDGGIDINGDEIADLLPGEEGYARTAIVNRLTNFELRSGPSRDTNKNTSVTEFGDVILQGGKFYAPFMIANAGSIGFDGFIAAEDAEGDSEFNNAANFIDDQVAYFSFIGANPDGSAHLQSHGNNIFGFEDLPANIFTDNDFNDAMFQIQVI